MKCRYVYKYLFDEGGLWECPGPFIVPVSVPPTRYIIHQQFIDNVKSFNLSQ